MRNFRSDYYTHYESLLPNLFPEIEIYLYDAYKGKRDTQTYDNFKSNIQSIYGSRVTEPHGTNNGLRFKITDFLIDVQPINQQGNSDIIQNFTGTSSCSFSVLREIPSVSDFNFNLQVGNNNNLFVIMGYDYEGYLADIEIEFGFKDGIDGTTIFKIRDSTNTFNPKNEIIFRGLISNVVTNETTLTIEMLDGMFEATNKQALIGERITNEIIQFQDRFFLDFKNENRELSSFPLSEIYGGWDLKAVKKTSEYNLKNYPLIPPEKDTSDPTVEIKIQRYNPESSNNEVVKKEIGDDEINILTKIDNKYSLIEANYVDKINQEDVRDFKNFSVNYQNGIVNFESPPIREPEGFLVSDYMTSYRYKHPSFLAEKLFNQLGYNTNNDGKDIDFKREELDPHYPAGNSDSETLENKVISHLGQITPLEDWKKEGIKAIHHCETDGLFYYYANKAIWRTDLNDLNEKLFNTTYDVLQIDSIYLNDFKQTNDPLKSNYVVPTSSQDSNLTERLRLIMSYKRPYRYLFTIPPVKGGYSGYISSDMDRTNVYPMRDFVSNMNERNLWKEDYVISIGYRDLDNITVNGVRHNIYFILENYLYIKEWDYILEEFKKKEKICKVPENFKIDSTHTNHAGNDSGERGKVFTVKNIRRTLLKTDPKNVSEWQLLDIASLRIIDDGTVGLNQDDYRYLMLWSDGYEANTVENIKIPIAKKQYLWFVRVDMEGSEGIGFKVTGFSEITNDEELIVDHFVKVDALDEKNTEVVGEINQEPDPKKIFKFWSGANFILQDKDDPDNTWGNVLDGVNELRYYKNDVDEVNGNKTLGDEMLEPKYSRRDFSQSGNSSMLDFDIEDNDFVLHKCHSTYYYPYFLGNELTTNFIIDKQKTNSAVNSKYDDAYLVGITSTTHQKYIESFYEWETIPIEYIDINTGFSQIYKSTIEFNATTQYIFLTYIRMNHFSSDGSNDDVPKIRLVANDAHYQTDRTSIDPNALSAWQHLVTLDIPAEDTGEFLLGWNFTPDLLLDRKDHVLTETWDAGDARWLYRNSTVLERFNNNGYYQSSNRFTGCDLCYEDGAVYVLCGNNISKFIRNKDIDSLNTGNGNNIYSLDTTWGEYKDIPDQTGALVDGKSGKTGRLFAVRWKDSSSSQLMEKAHQDQGANPGNYESDQDEAGGNFINLKNELGNYVNSFYWKDSVFSPIGNEKQVLYKDTLPEDWYHNRITSTGRDPSSWRNWWSADQINTGSHIFIDGFGGYSEFLYSFPSICRSEMIGRVGIKESDEQERNSSQVLNQMYGLTKMKGQEIFSFVAVNRDGETYFPTTNHDRDRVKNRSIGGDKMWSNIRSQVHTSNKEDWRYGKDGVHQFMEGLNSVILMLDLRNVDIYDNIPVPKTIGGDNGDSDFYKIGRLRPFVTIMPTAFHDAFFKDLDERTNYYEQMKWVKTTGGKYESLDKVIDNNIGKGYAKFVPQKITNYDTTSGRGDGSWWGDIQLATTINSGNRPDALNPLRKTKSNKFKFTPMKSMWIYASIDRRTLDAKEAFGQGIFPLGSTTIMSEQNRSINYSQYALDENQTGNFNVGFDVFTGKIPTNTHGSIRFSLALNRQRRIFANTYLLNSLLPKTSQHVGSNLTYLVGNYGEYLTNMDRLDIPEQFKDFEDLTISNKHDSHGTLVYMPSNVNISESTDSYFNSETKGYMNVHEENKVYKDFLTKPLNIIKYDDNKLTSKEEVHFITGSSIGYKILKEESTYSKTKTHKTEKWTNPLLFYKKFHDQNFLWTCLSDNLKPRVPLAIFSSGTIKDALQDLAMIMDYDFGVRNGEPFFEPTYNNYIFPFIYYKNNSEELEFSTPKFIQDLPNSVSNQPSNLKDVIIVPDEINLSNGKYFYSGGEIIFISEYIENLGFCSITGHDNKEECVLADATWTAGDGSMVLNIPPISVFDELSPSMEDNLKLKRWRYAYRQINDSISNPDHLDNLNPTTTSNSDVIVGNNGVKRLKEVKDCLFFEIKMIADDYNIINIVDYGRTYDFQDYTDIHIYYGQDKVFKRSIESNPTLKRIYRRDIAFVENKDWINYLAKKIQRTMTLKRHKITFLTKIIPSLKYGDYIAIYNKNFSIGTEYVKGNTPKTYKSYQIFKISNVSHDISTFTSNITAYTIDTTSLGVKNITVGAVTVIPEGDN